MNEYEKYRLQWMLDHDYSLPDLLERLSDIAMNENLDEIQNPRVMLNEAFERLEYEQGFKNKEIWLCKDEWEHDLYSSNEYSLTDAGKTKVKHFIEDCSIKQDSILKGGLDTAKETTLPSIEDILCNVEDMVDENEKYAFRCFLLRLGFIGQEYKTTRKVLMKNLEGNAAWKKK